MTTQQNNDWGDIPQGWEVVALGDLGSVEMCRRIFKHETQTSGDIPFFKIGTFGGEPDAYISNAIFEEYKNKYPYPQIGDILISAAGTIGRTVIFSGEKSYYQDSNIVWLKIDKNKINNAFLYYFYQNTKWTSLEGSTIKRLYNSDLLSKLITLPPKPEQSAIATVLSDTDKWIDSLTSLIAKKQAIKSATMSQLLSGQKRLPQFANHSDGTPKTYIQTDNGKIPKDWEVVALGEICHSFKTGKLDANAMIENGTYPFFTCAKKVYRINNYAFDLEALLISGNGANVGYIHYYNGKFNAYQRTYILSNFSQNIIFIKYYLEEELSRRIDIEMRAGNTPYITMDTLTDMMIKIPKSPTEQTAIAQILSDMDSEIIALEHRLTKARALKQGLMHQLLTGKIRLFSGSLNN